MSLELVELIDDLAIAAFLEPERLWTAYGLCDLNPSYRQYTRYLGAMRDGLIVAVVMIYAPPGFSGVLPFGESDAVGEILTTSRDLPSQPYVLLGEEHVKAVERRYRLSPPEEMVRMAVDRRRYSPAPSSERVVRLSPAHREALVTLYGTERNSAFLDPTTLAYGIYRGVFEHDSLVAAAGTHTWSRLHRIGTIGGVYTHPDYRGKGLARMTTGAVTQALFDAGVQDVVLNVRAENETARRVYGKLGFTSVRSYLEAPAVDRLHQPGNADTIRRVPPGTLRRDATPRGPAARM